MNEVGEVHTDSTGLPPPTTPVRARACANKTSVISYSPLSGSLKSLFISDPIGKQHSSNPEPPSTPKSLSCLQRYKIQSERRKGFAKRVARSHASPRTKNLKYLSSVLEKINAKRDDPLIGVPAFDRFVADNLQSFEEKEKALESLDNEEPVTSAQQRSTQEETPTSSSKRKRWRSVSKKARAIDASKSLDKFVKAKYVTKYNSYKYKFTGSQWEHLKRLSQPKYRSLLHIAHPRTVHNRYLYKNKHVRRAFVLARQRGVSCASAQAQRIYSKWKESALPALPHNGELLREIALHSAVRFGQEGPQLTVAASDVIATAVQVFIRKRMREIVAERCETGNVQSACDELVDSEVEH